MFNIFNSNVFVEIGEAIGNIRNKARRHHSVAELVDQAFRGRLKNVGSIEVPIVGRPLAYPDNDIDIIDAEYVVLTPNEEDIL
jgi:hypothetical protein